MEVFLNKRIFLFMVVMLLLSLVSLDTLAGDNLQEMNKLVYEFQTLLREKREAGVDVSRAMELDRKSMEASIAGRHEDAQRLLGEAISILKGRHSGGEGEKNRLREPASDLKNIKSKSLSGVESVETAFRGDEDSPFGIHDPNIIKMPLRHPGEKPPGLDEPQDIAMVGAKWVRYAGVTGVNWDGIEREKGKYDWLQTDFMYGETYKNNIKMMVTVATFNRLDMDLSDKGHIPREKRGYLPKHMDWYLIFLRKVVERYDGDGVDDAQGSPVVDVWQVENELDTPGGWNDSPKNYAYLLKESYRVIKEANPRARVAIAGMATTRGLPLYSKVLSYLKSESGKPGEGYFDIFDFHWSGQFRGTYKEQPLGNRLDDFIAKLKGDLKKDGYAHVPLWITEMSDYSGKPNADRFGRNYIEHSETDQAISMFKMYIYSLSHGVNKAFWVSFTDWHGFGLGGPGKVGGYFDNVGLITNPRSGKESYKKLSYYTYKKMSEVLDGADMNNIRIIQEENGIYIYLFKMQKGPVWVAWSDKKNAIGVKISNVVSKKVGVIPVVPANPTGKDVGRYEEAFKKKDFNIQRGEISLELKDIPIFIQAD